MKGMLIKLPRFRGALVWVPDKNGQARTYPGGLEFKSHLEASWFRGDKLVDQFDLGSGLVVTAGVVYMAAEMAGGASDINAFTYHAVGIGTTAPVIANTAMENTTGAPARVNGTSSTPGSTNIFQSLATVSFTGTLAITEWGLFSASSGGTLWDRKTFTAINVVNGDSIQFTYQLTITAGG
jgi:hypothetical protein